MTTRVIWVQQNAPFKQLAAALREHRVSAFPVLDESGKVIGVVSEADMLTKEALAGGYDGIPGVLTGLLRHKEQDKARGITAGDLMTAPAVTIGAQETVEEAARVMYKRKVKRLPVVDAQGHLTGIVSRADVLSVFDCSDDDLRQEITESVILGEFLSDPDTIAVTVRDGVVTLMGIPETDELGHEIVGRVRHLQGVVAVRDRLSYPPPSRD
ncbi:MAG: CBS domain-containing protein [Streptosporangiaceae bacterium]